MRKFTACLLLLVSCLSASGQKRGNGTPVFAEWGASPTVHATPPQYAKEPAFFILNGVNMDYRYEGKSVTVYYTLHRIVKVLDDKGIEQFNKMSISVYHNTKIESIKARTILPNGRVHELSRDMIKVTRNEYGAYEVDFALEGVEKNAEIEILLKEIKQVSLFGSEVYQYHVPVMNAYFEMSYPREMVFEEKGYNGFPDAKDTLIKSSNRRQIKIYKSDIPALDKEPGSFYDLYRMRAEYKISYYTDEDERTRLYTWDDLANRLHDNHYKITDKEKITVNKYLTSLGITDHGNDLDNIRKIETGIKTGITLYGSTDDDDDDKLDSIITKKSATETGYLKLFAACFTQAGVKHELGMTTDKHDHTLDTKFENWATMENYIFYFPALKRYLAPTSIYLRYPVIPTDMIGNKGVFCAIPAVGEATGSLSDIHTITPLPASESQSNIKANVTFNKEMEPTVDIIYSYSGYAAMDLRQEVVKKTGDKKTALVKRMIPLAEKTEDIAKFSIANEGFDNYYTNKPLEITATVKAPQLVENAGAKYLFKIGDIIGKQKELYKETERKLPVDLEYPDMQNRTITVTLPAGYKILNPDALRQQAGYVDANGKPVIAFKADYKLKGNVLVVTINEMYSQLHFAVSEYERYRSVVNASADFNKVTLVLSK